MNEDQTRSDEALKGLASIVPPVDASSLGQVANLASISDSVVSPVHNVLAGSNFKSLVSPLSSSQMSGITETLNTSALKLPDYDLTKIYEGTTPNYTIPDRSLRDLAVSSCFKSSWHQLIIVGNGFDLQCGLRSRFRDFFEPRFEKIAAIKSNDRETWQKFLEDRCLTLWDFILEASIDNQWCDVEEEVERWVLSAADQNPETSLLQGALSAMQCEYLFADEIPFTPLNEDKRRHFFNESGKIRIFNNIARYIAVLHPALLGEKREPERLIELLKRDLGRLEQAFGDYLSKEIAYNDGYKGECKKLCQAIDEDGKRSDEDFYMSTSVLSFNYTNVAESYFDKGDDGVFVNIHGKLGEDIIFGIDGKDCMDNPVAAPFTKTYRLMLRGGSRTGGLVSTANSSNLQDATDVIKFYGHSLGKADYSYFQSIFDGVDLYESETVLVFYFPLDSSDDAEVVNNMWRMRLSNSINDLLVAYGATMDNIDHGKNLMHKLLLEGRLIIRGLPVD